MDLYVMDKNFKTIAVIDEYTSIIWTRRYFECGDFELYLPATHELLDILKCNHYIYRKDCDTVMIIEAITITTNSESGNYFTVSGRSAESILSRRVINPPSYWNIIEPGNRASSIISPVIEVQLTDERRINEIDENIQHGDEDNILTERYDSPQPLGKNLYEHTVEIIKQYGTGMKFIFNEDKTKFIIFFYNGQNRTRNQTKNSRVIFSKDYDNIISSEYSIDFKNLSNVALIAGAGEGADRIKSWVSKDYWTPSGLDRYEMYVDARDLQKEKNGNILSDNDYREVLKTRAKEKMAEASIVEGFNAEVETSLQFEYKKDWDLGDIVEIETEYGINAQARIIEVIECDDETGYKVAPTLSTWEGM